MTRTMPTYQPYPFQLFSHVRLHVQRECYIIRKLSDPVSFSYSLNQIRLREMLFNSNFVLLSMLSSSEILSVTARF